MNLSKFSSTLLILPLVAACSHSSTSPEARNASSPTAQFDESPAPPSDGAYASGPAGEMQPASPSATSMDSVGRAGAPAPAAAPRSTRAGSAYQPPAEKKSERPGLGTTWGETRTSYVSNQSFDRADYSHPFALVSLNYNDESGVQAMARRAGNAYGSFDGSNLEVAQGALTVHILDENGSPLPSQSFGGRDYVVGADGQRYTIQIENHTGNRFEAVATVDGLDVVDGKDGSLSKRGYLIDPWSSLNIDGFRRSQAEVAAFRFGRVMDSYAARKGNDRNVGVIGIAFFHERGSQLPWTERELQRRDSANPFPGQFASPPPPNMAR
ncbi:MAG TPA: hypothetical protein VGL19_15505 [Polyangiaceae bacterium]